MATRVLLHLRDATNKCALTSVQFHRTKFQVQSVLKYNQRLERVRSLRVQYAGQSNSKKLFKAFVFATTFSGATLVGAAILQYERLRAQTMRELNRQFFRPVKVRLSGWRLEMHNWWNSLTEGQRMFYFICFANTLVYLAWRIPQIRPVMLKYFTTNPASNVTILPMLLSTFSHYNLWHLALNMYVLHSLSTPAAASLGREHFLALYLSSGVIANFFSQALIVLRNRTGSSLGASGAIMGILGYVCLQYPNAGYCFIFLPQFQFSGVAIIKAVMAFDAVGCLMGWKFIDHAAHLGGAFFGIFWQYWGVENIWRNREPLLRYWHEFRNPPKKN